VEHGGTVTRLHNTRQGKSGGENEKLQREIQSAKIKYRSRCEQRESWFVKVMDMQQDVKENIDAGKYLLVGCFFNVNTF